MSKFVKNLKGFTLVEVLIVIVIVGILIAALLPRLQGSQARARDVARKGHVQQIATAYGIYAQDNAAYPLTGTCISGGTADILTYMSSVPTDPRATQANVGPCTGEYRYIPLEGGEGGLVVATLETADAGGNFDWSVYSNSGTVSNANTGALTDAQAAVCGGGAGTCTAGTQYFGILLR